MRSLLVGVMVLSACSFGMQRVDPAWDGTTEPDCNDSLLPVAADAVAAGILLGAGLAASEGAQSSTNDTVAIMGFAGGLIYAISSAVGESRHRDCENAYAAWRIGGAVRGGDEERANREARQMERQHPELAAAEKPAATEKPAEVPRGFFCVTSAAHADAGFCVREKADCQRSRDAAIVAIPDIAECALQEKAWCTGERCAPSADVCESRRERLGSDAASCIESE